MYGNFLKQKEAFLSLPRSNSQAFQKVFVVKMKDVHIHLSVLPFKLYIAKMKKIHMEKCALTLMKLLVFPEEK